MEAALVLNGRYELLERLGQGPWAETWTARDGSAQATGQAELVVKALSLGDLPDWKSFDLFEREVAALKAVRHPAIPRYVDSFRWQDDRRQYLVLVMERVPGTSLARQLEAGRRWTEADIERMLAELLDILAYLHSLRPPLIHRDINPKNIILRPDGSIALVDFSGVQDAVRLAYRDTTTMVGSAGYAPLEQVSGRASVRSDLYAAAATAAQLLTRVHPSDLPRKGLKPDPGALVELSPRLAHVLGIYLEPDEDLRALPPEEAAAILRHGLPVPRTDHGIPAATASGRDQQVAWEPRPKTILPSSSRVAMLSDRDSFSLRIPPGSPLSPQFLAGLGFGLFFTAFTAFWTFMALRMRAPFFFPLFSIPFWVTGVTTIMKSLKDQLGSVELVLDRSNGYMYKEHMFNVVVKVRSGELSDLGTCHLASGRAGRQPQTDSVLSVDLGSSPVTFGRSLSTRERQAVADAINAWVGASRQT